MVMRGCFEQERKLKTNGTGNKISRGETSISVFFFYCIFCEMILLKQKTTNNEVIS